MAHTFGHAFLEEPDVAFNTALQQFGGTPNQQSFFRQPSQFQAIHDLFKGALGRQVEAGENLTEQGLPIALFQDFLKGENPFVPFSFQSFFQNIPRAMRPGGLNATALNPQFRFITQF